MNYKLVAYAMEVASFLVQKLKSREKIKQIILFGSVSRGEAEKDSDIDLFIDVINANNKFEEDKLEKEIKLCLSAFLNSAKYKNYWRLLGITNNIQLTIGKLSKWKELNTSIISNGVVLFGKYKPEVKEGTHNVFFIWENIKPNSKRVLFNKQMCGYIQNKKFYKGLLQKYNGKRLGKGCIIVPLESSNFFLRLFRKYNITVKIKKIIDYT